MDARTAAEILFAIAGPEWDQRFFDLCEARSQSRIGKGCYVIWAENRAWYVGQSETVPRRLASHFGVLPNLKCSVIVPTKKVNSMTHVRDLEGRLIRALRPAKNVSQGRPSASKYGDDVKKRLASIGRDEKWLASALDVPAGQVSDWITGKADPETYCEGCREIPKEITALIEAEAALRG